jgi:hypothetical protein
MFQAQNVENIERTPKYSVFCRCEDASVAVSQSMWFADVYIFLLVQSSPMIQIRVTKMKDGQ